MKELGMEGFAAPVKLSCADHNGHGGISRASGTDPSGIQGALDTADQGQGAAADQLGRQGICESQYRLAEADRAVRQVIVSKNTKRISPTRCKRQRASLIRDLRKRGALTIPGRQRSIMLSAPGKS